VRAAHKVGKREQKAEKTKEEPYRGAFDASFPQAFGERRCAEREDGEKQGTSRKFIQGKACPRCARNERAEEGKSLAALMNREAPKEESCTAISDISLPMMMTEAVTLLSQREELDLTLFSSQTVKVGEASYLTYEENTLQQKNRGEYLFSRNTLKKSPDGEENKVVQERFASSAGVKVVYDLISGAKTEESTLSAAASPWPALMEEAMLSVHQLSAPALEAGAEADTVTFSLSNEVSYGLVQKITAAMEGNGLNSASFSATSSGVMTVSHKTGEMTAFSLSVQANLASGPVSLQISLTVNQTEAVQVPEIQPLTFYNESTHD
jgi:glycine cleavage system regulatory protein